ncbi:hypothetical protein HYE42_03825 [Mycoplasmopsis bovis]|nr:hypothetical protein [Mycoplasmopsis bovis]QQH20498.1 hypothetical protein HYE42_03825 [Mycoplasmopsis bovis]
MWWNQEEEKKPEAWTKNPGGDKNPGEKRNLKVRSKNQVEIKTLKQTKKPEGEKKPEGDKNLKKIKRLSENKTPGENKTPMREITEEGSTNNGIGWGENHLWGKDEDDLEKSKQESDEAEMRRLKIQKLNQKKDSDTESSKKV